MVTCTICLELGSLAAKKALTENYKYTAIKRDEELQKTFIYFETIPQKKHSGSENADLSPNKPYHHLSLEKWGKSDRGSEKSSLPNLNRVNISISRQNSLRLTDLENLKDEESNISSLNSSAPCVMDIKRMQSSGMETNRMQTSLSSDLSSTKRRQQTFALALRSREGEGNEIIENSNKKIDPKKSFYRHLSKTNSSTSLSDSSQKSFYMHLSARKLQEQNSGQGTPTAAVNGKKKQIQESQVEMMYSNALDVPVATIQKKFNTDKNFRARFAAQGRNRSFFL